VRDRIASADGHAFVVLHGLRWVELAALDAPGPQGFAVAHVVARVAHDAADDAGRQALCEELRDCARRLAVGMPQAARVIALIDAIDDPERLSEMIIANLRCSVEDKARYAVEPGLIGRLRVAIDLCRAQIAASAGAAG
jgi:hypothetical protein